MDVSFMEKGKYRNIENRLSAAQIGVFQYCDKVGMGFAIILDININHSIHYSFITDVRKREELSR